MKKSKYKNIADALLLSQMMRIKGSIFLTNRQSIIEKRFNKLKYGFNSIIKCWTWQPVKFQLVSRSWNEMIFYRISELMLPTLIQRYDKNHFIFHPVERETNWTFTGCQMPHFIIVLILYIEDIQMFVVNMTFISSSEVKKCIFHECRRHEWNIHFFSLHEMK